jgi:hypothetical protein
MELARKDAFDAAAEASRRGGRRCGACFADGYRGWHELRPDERAEIQATLEHDRIDHAKYVWKRTMTGAGWSWDPYIESIA